MVRSSPVEALDGEVAVAGQTPEVAGLSGVAGLEGCNTVAAAGNTVAAVAADGNTVAGGTAVEGRAAGASSCGEDNRRRNPRTMAADTSGPLNPYSRSPTPAVEHPSAGPGTGVAAWSGNRKGGETRTWRRSKRGFIPKGVRLEYDRNCSGKCSSSS